MAILQLVLTAITRSAGKILNTAFGWATMLLFGKVPKDRQIYLSIISFGSVIWLIALVGVAFPRFGTFVLAFLPLPDWVDDFWVRMAMLAAVVLVPLAVGVVSLFLVDRESRPKGVGAKVKAVLKGYPYTLGLAVTLLMMLIVAPLMKVKDIAKRWTSTHVPMIVEPQDYSRVVDDVALVLKKGGHESERRRASWMLRLPTKVFTLLAGGAVENLVADELALLKSKDLEITLHPSDLVIRGRERQVTRAHALITEQLTFTDAYQTWTKEANQIEDRLERLWRDLKAEGGAGLERASRGLFAIERDLATIELPYEEWEVLFREKLIVERHMLRAAAGIDDRPGDLTATRGRPAAASGTRPTHSHGVAARVSTWTAAVVAIGTLVWKTMRLRRQSPDGSA